MSERYTVLSLSGSITQWCDIIVSLSGCLLLLYTHVIVQVAVAAEEVKLQMMIVVDGWSSY